MKLEEKIFAVIDAILWLGITISSIAVTACICIEQFNGWQFAAMPFALIAVACLSMPIFEIEE
jgi:hypothetical protein